MTEKYTEAKYRHEYKYVCDAMQNAVLKTRARAILKRDEHVGFDGFYRIRSLYFDDLEDRCYYENEGGIGERDKYRIRIYNNSPDRISLECKRKENDKVHKTSCLLTPMQYEALVSGRPVDAAKPLPELAQRLSVLEQCRGMAPKIIVSYDRTPYVYRYGNVRVTFDCNIASSPQTGNFFGECAARRQILPTGQQLLEVKYDEYLPDPIYHALSLANMQRIKFSKYYLCRKYGRSGGVQAALKG